MNISCFGCSFTWGAELSDPGLSWPHRLGSYLPASIKNLGICGASNRTIARTLMTHLIDHRPDAVVIMWTYPGRYEFVVDNNNFIVAHCDSAIGLDQRGIPDYFNKFSQDFFRSVGTTDSALVYESLMGINHAQLMLESQKIPYIFSRVHDLESTDVCHSNVKQLFDFYAPDMLLFDGNSFEAYARKINSWGISHPLEQAQDHVAQHIVQELKKITN
jgi:hypothetical protein